MAACGLEVYPVCASPAAESLRQSHTSNIMEAIQCIVHDADIELPNIQCNRHVLKFSSSLD